MSPIDPRIPLMGQPAQFQSPLDILSTVAQVQGIREQTEARRAAGEERRQKAADEAAKRARAAAVDAALQSAISIGPDGQPSVDYQKLIGHLPATEFFAVKQEMDKVKTTALQLQTSNLTFEEKAAAYRGALARGVAAGGYDPKVYALAIGTARKAGALTQEQADAGFALLEQPDAADQIRRSVDSAIAQVGGKVEGLEKIETVDAQGQPVTQFVTPKEGATYPVAPKASEHSTIYKEWQDYKSAGGTLGFDAYQTMDANRKAVRISTGSAGQRPITQTAEAGLISRLNSQWTTATKPQRELAQQVSAMRSGLAAAERGDMAQGTEAVLQPFLKILDPNSVVREGEFWRLQEGQSTIARAQGIVQRLTKGGFVPLAELKKYATLAEEIAKRQDTYVAGVRGRIGKVAERYQIPSELVFESDPTVSAAPVTAAPATTVTGPKIGERRTIKGQLAEWDGKGWKAVR